LAALLVMATLLLRRGLDFLLGDEPLLLLFVLPILVSAWLGGWRAGLLATVLAALLTDYFLLPPRGEFRIASPIDQLRWAELWVVGIVVSVLMESLHRQRRRLERSRDASRRLASIVESSNDAILGKTLDGTIVAWNAAAERMYGYSASEAVGKGISMLAPAEDGDEMPAILERIKHGQRVERFETRRRRKDGSWIHVALSVSPVLAEDGSVIGASTIARDITAQKKAEEDLRLTAEELRRSNGDLEQFAYVASHDLQEPLRMVTGFVQLLQRRYSTRLDAEADKYIDFAVDGAKRMQTLINDLLAYSRVGTRGRPATTTAADVAFRRALANLCAGIEETAAEVTCGELPVVRADDGQLAQIFQNLVGNALKFRAAAPPKIRVEARRQDDGWLFSVGDNGIGIAPEYRDRIFMIFQRLHARREYPGTGIGLAICKRIVDRHGGRMWVESQAGHGSTFYFTLPD
jgi:PAS domain S-box-containing protein